MYDDGWDVLREKRLQALKDLGVAPEDARPFPRLPSVKAWDTMAPEERAEAARDMEVYAAMVDYMDEQIGRVFGYLNETGEYDNTVIVFFSDNGANGAHATAYPGQTDEHLASFDNSLENRGLPNSFVEPGPGWAQASMSPSRMFKAFTAEGGIRTPLIVKLPGTMEKAGTINHSFFHVRDIMPTFLDLAGVTAPEEIDGRRVRPMQGRSVLPMWEGETDSPYEGADRVGYEVFGLKAYFVGDWKILWMPEPFGPGEWELFNLTEDPAEVNDLSKEHPEKVEEMVALWEKYRKDNGVLDISFDLSVVK
jgi:arylsulfatase